ncbi:hybrid sensor histidine kinase/response regulator [Pedobacter sp. KBW06]|uniref:sensor histidine kinase n=1 Tax=Pedobacter sp. KBW06 TaxID=2153359 RepID=UPI000F5A4E0F|nr:PAS domain-containing sensor histidine kinase [Pedobacter sp. KBW06]RQO74659.1 hybrid sensor histidine kinase/response regulator [Pedobacter sp. KBW06]
MITKIPANPSSGLLPVELFDCMPVAVYVCDHLGYLTFYNKAAANLWGREPELGKDLWCGSWKIFWPDGTPMAPDTCPMARTLKEGMPVIEEEIMIQCPDGTMKNVLPNPVPLFDESGVLRGAVNTLLDITEQRQGEKKQAMLAAIIECSEDAIVSKGLDGLITSWNQGAEKLFGYTEKEVLGRHISLLIPKDRLDEENLIIDRVRNNKTVEHFETVRITKNGASVPISLTVSPIRDQKGRIIGASKIARDISIQKQSEAQLQKLYDDIQTMNSRKDEFIGMASHELKTPVTSIDAFLQLVQRSLKLEDKDKELVLKARNQVAKLISLISDLLDVTKIQTGKLAYTFTSFDFNDLLKEVIEVMQQNHPGHEINLNHPAGILNVYADKQRLEQVIINLVSNAIKYAPNTNKMKIGVLNVQEHLQLSVQDFGPGIDLPEQEHIFSRFYQIKKPNGNASGLGIGLYISKEIIDRHQGKIWVESSPGNGSTFSFQLPLHSQD